MSTEFRQKVAVRLEDLNAMVTRIGHFIHQKQSVMFRLQKFNTTRFFFSSKLTDDVTLGVNGHTLGAQELAVARALRTQEASRLEIGIDD